MKFCFYPDHSYGCSEVGHCPHLGGAALGTLVHAASEQDEFLRSLQGTIDFERERNEQLADENERLKRELEQAKLELKLERQNKFATSQEKQERQGAETSESSAETSREGPPEPKKRGAPVGHPGWFRPAPTE